MRGGHSDTLNGLNRTKFAVFGLLALVVLTVVNLLLDIPALTLPDVTRFDTHVAQVRALLPPVGGIGYYTDYSDAPGAVDALREYMLMQYALAPVVVEKRLDRKFVITSLHHPEVPLGIPYLLPVRDFGSGIRLLRNITK